MKLRSLLLATSFLALAAPAFAQTVSESPNPVAPGAALTVTYSDPGAQPGDNIWIQDANGNQLEVANLNGSTSGTITYFTAPTTPGDYRIYGGFHGTAAGPADFTVSAAPPPSGPSVDMSDGSHIAPVSGDVLGVNSAGAWAPVVGGQGPAGPAGPQGPAGQNAGQNTYPACPAPADQATVGNSMFCSANGHTDIAVSPAANIWVYFGPASATAP